MNDAVETLAIGCSSALIFGVPFIFFAFLRYLRYKETLALAEQGLIHPQVKGNGKGTLRWGMIIMFVGLALTIGLWPIGFMIDAGVLGFGPWMLPGLIPFFFGCALVAIYSMTEGDKERDGEEEVEPIPPHKQNGE